MEDIGEGGASVLHDVTNGIEPYYKVKLEFCSIKLVCA